MQVISKRSNEKGQVEYHVDAISDWEGFDSIVKYLKKYRCAIPLQIDDKVYSRRWVLKSGSVSISIYHDSQIGNYLVREDGINDQSLLEQIEADLINRFQE